ncbi:CFC_HP_G0063230.mRNA.1.CDS.1 [Saccharomyces cerevisiae]|nr:CFC_HP_G0063230.mRNA.1.CDS.1 [Saccharomyces cerevisiae]CAI6599056.1 CFC_HP_G0063230.mRNA.1.CDS.1 [Saccharomyces cerevisiae]
MENLNMIDIQKFPLVTSYSTTGSNDQIELNELKSAMEVLHDSRDVTHIFIRAKTGRNEMNQIILIKTF